MTQPEPVLDPDPSSSRHVKRGSGASARRIRREVETVRRVAGPSVIRLVELRDDPATDTATATYATVAGGAVASWQPVDAAQVAALFAAAAQAVHELHRCGVAHGDISAEHILIDEHGRPVLCGLADARGVSDVEVGADLRALASTLVDVVETLNPVGSSWAHRLSRRGRTQHQLRALAASVEARRVTDARSMVNFAAALSRLGVGAAPASPPSTSPIDARADDRPAAPGLRHLELARPVLADSLPATRRWRARPPEPVPRSEGDGGRARWWTAAAVAVIVGIGCALVLTDRTAGSSAPDPAPPAPVVESAASPPPATHPTPERVGRCNGLMVDGECTPIEVGAGVVTVGDERLAVGAPTDHLVVGDWDCDGVPTVAAVRPETGEVFVFDRWSFEESVTARTVAVLDDVGRPSAVERTTGCHDLRVPYGADTWILSGAAT